jgi:large subunit ribosomal protein L17
MEAGPRRALIRGQLTSLVLHEAITTTEAKAKEVAPKFERLVTYAKKGNLAGGRLLRRELLTELSAQKMLQELAPKFETRQGGYTRIVKLANRLGDNAPMARLSLVLDQPVATAKTATAAKTAAAAKTSVAKTPAAKETK